jgi:tetratricopeptide (TPR) repeat protein
MKVKKWLLPVLLSLSLGMGGWRWRHQTSPAASIEQTLEQGRQAECRLELTLAEQRYREALARSPKDPRALSALATLYSNMERTEQAEPLLQRLATDYNPPLTSWPLPLLRGYSVEVDAGYYKARAAVQKSLQAYPQSADLWQDLADLTLHHFAHCDEGQLKPDHAQEVEHCLAEAAARGARGWRYYLLLGQLQAANYRYDEAYRAFEAALADTSLPRTWERLTVETNLGLIAIHQGRGAQAHKMLVAAADTFANMPSYHRLRGRPYREFMLIVRHAYLGEKIDPSIVQTYVTEARKTLAQGHSPYRSQGVDLVPNFYQSLQAGDFAQADALSERLRHSLPFTRTCATGRMYAPTVMCAIYLDMASEATLRGKRDLALSYLKKAYALYPRDASVVQALADLSKGTAGQPNREVEHSKEVVLPALGR